MKTLARVARATSLLGLVLLSAVPAFGQGAPAPIRVATCGSGAPYSAPGTVATPTVDVNGLTCTPTGGAGSASTSFSPGGTYITPQSVTTTSSNVALPSGQTVVVYNTGTVPAYVKLGVGIGTTATLANDQIPAGGSAGFTVGSNTYLAAITASGTTTLNISGGSGLANSTSGTVASGGGAGTPAFTPGGTYATLAATTATSNVALPAGAVVVVYNTGTVPVFVRLGTSSAVTAVLTNDMVPAGGSASFTVGSNTYIAGITSSGTASLNISGGAGIVGGQSGIPVVSIPPTSGYTPSGNYAVPLTVTTTSSTATLPAGTTVVVYNVGTVAAYVKVGSGSVTATTANEVIQPNSWLAFAPGSNTLLGAITASGTTTLNISSGSGLPEGAGGGTTAGGGGGLSVQDSAAWTVGVSNFTPGGGFYRSVPQNLNDGQQGTFALAQNRSLHVIDDNSALLLAAAQAPAQGQATTGPPSYTTATAGFLSLDLGGGLRTSSFAPSGSYTTPLAVTTTSANVALPTGTVVTVDNVGANVAYVNLGVGAGTTATTSQIAIQPNSWKSFAVGANTYLAAITGTATTTLNVAGGAGQPAGSGGGGGTGGGGGAITAAANSYAVGAIQDGADVTLGTKADAAYAGSGAATLISIAKGIYAVQAAPLPTGANTIGNVGLVAGSAIVGKFGIDQTTPGTTNGVVLNAGSNIAGKFGIDQTTPGTTNGVVLNTGSNTIGTFTSNVVTPTSTLTLTSATTAYTAGQLIANNATAGSITVPSFSITNNKAIISRMKLISNDATATAWGNTTIWVDLWSAAPTFTNGDRGAYLPATGTANHLGSFSCVMRGEYGDGIWSDCAPNVGSYVILSLGGSTVYWSLQAYSGSGVTGASKTFTLIPEVQL